MGQAKRRGTFEERKKRSIAKNGVRMPKVTLKGLRDSLYPMSLAMIPTMLAAGRRKK